MASTPQEEPVQRLYPPNVQFNGSKIYSTKFLSSCFAGAAAGILGLENWLGFALFLISTLLTSACLYVQCKGKPSKFIPGGWTELLNPGQENTLSFVLVWTLFFGIVHGICSRLVIRVRVRMLMAYRWYSLRLSYSDVPNIPRF